MRKFTSDPPLWRVLFFLFLVGCTKSPLSKVNESDVGQYLTSKLKDYDADATLESFSLTKLDTVTLRNQYYRLYYAMIDKTNEDGVEADKLIDRMKNRYRLSHIEESAGLYDMAKTSKADAQEASEKARVILSNDSLMVIDMKAVRGLAEKSDSIKPVSYTLLCAYRLKMKDKSTKKDTAYITLDTDYTILDAGEYNKRLNRLYRPKSNFTL